MRRVVLLDNKDSFVWNLAQALMVLGADVDVVRSDRARVEDLSGARALVVSPGPGRPEDAGISVAAIRELSGQVPILGVCLGHQAIGIAFGARVVRTAPRHGMTSPIRHAGAALLEGLPSPFLACRYHSLCVVDLPDVLVPIAHADDGVLMGMRHAEHPTFGVQFHPESFRSEHGPALLRRFLAVAA